MAEPDWENRLESLCRRLSPDPETGATVLVTARGAGADQAAQVAAALEGSRQAERLGGPEGRAPGPPADAAAKEACEGAGQGLAAAVATELRAATARLTREQRELLALRGLLRLSHEQLGRLLELDADQVAERLGDARVALRAELRGSAPPPSRCPDRERTLRAATRRQDGEAVTQGEEDWLFTHLVGCDDCAQLHAVLLEGGTSYASWSS